MSSEYNKNHYVPKFYLKNFTNRDNHFWVYDKQSKWKNSSLLYKTPGEVCFEKERNIIKGPKGEKTHILESKTYSYFDNIHAATFNLLAQCEFDRFPWTERTIADLELFIPLLFSCSPISDKQLIAKINKAEYLDEFGIGIWDEETKENIYDKGFHKEVLNDPNIQKAIRPSIAFASFGKPHPIYDKLEWRLFYGEENTPNLASDNPIIFKNSPREFEDFRSSIILPVSNQRTLIRIPIIPDMKIVHNPILQDLIIFHQATRYVICSDKEHLTKVAELYYSIYKNKIEILKPAMFEFYDI